MNSDDEHRRELNDQLQEVDDLLRRIVSELAEIRRGITILTIIAIVGAVIFVLESCGVEPLFGATVL